jgi:hypothetical protein
MPLSSDSAPIARHVSPSLRTSLDDTTRRRMAYSVNTLCTVDSVRQFATIRNAASNLSITKKGRRSCCRALCGVASQCSVRLGWEVSLRVIDDPTQP